HASMAFDAGIDLFIGLNPLVPVDASRARDPRGGRTPRLSSGGLPMELSQTFRTLLQSRMQVGMQRHAQQYDDIDQIVFEPSPRDGDMFFTNAFSYGVRADVCDFAYRATLEELRQRRDQLTPHQARHGLTLRDDVLADPEHSLASSLSAPARRINDTSARLGRTLDDVEALIRERYG